jgi:hypothetical protein
MPITLSGSLEWPLYTGLSVYKTCTQPITIYYLYDYRVLYFICKQMIQCFLFNLQTLYTDKPVYKGHSREPDNVVGMSSCLLYTG